jgi:hypothetical protein
VAPTLITKKKRQSPQRESARPGGAGSGALLQLYSLNGSLQGMAPGETSSFLPLQCSNFELLASWFTGAYRDLSRRILSHPLSG